jgi:hypothetical protein
MKKSKSEVPSALEIKQYLKIKDYHMLDRLQIVKQRFDEISV